MKKQCPWWYKCRNGADGCWMENPENCIRYCPTEGTNLVEVQCTVELPPEIDSEKFSQYLTNWIECMGWSYIGIIKPYSDEEENKDDTNRKVAKWLYWDGWCGNHDQRIDDAKCSLCGYKHPTVVYKDPNNLSDYCGGCGAKMIKW